MVAVDVRSFMVTVRNVADAIGWSIPSRLVEAVLCWDSRALYIGCPYRASTGEPVVWAMVPAVGHGMPGSYRVRIQDLMSTLPIPSGLWLPSGNLHIQREGPGSLAIVLAGSRRKHTIRAEACTWFPRYEMLHDVRGLYRLSPHELLALRAGAPLAVVATEVHLCPLEEGGTLLAWIGEDYAAAVPLAGLSCPEPVVSRHPALLGEFIAGDHTSWEVYLGIEHHGRSLRAVRHGSMAVHLPLVPSPGPERTGRVLRAVRSREPDATLRLSTLARLSHGRALWDTRLRCAGGALRVEVAPAPGARVELCLPAQSRGNWSCEVSATYLADLLEAGHGNGLWLWYEDGMVCAMREGLPLYLFMRAL